MKLKLYAIKTPEMFQEWLVMAENKHDAKEQFMEQKPEYGKPKMTEIWEALND